LIELTDKLITKQSLLTTPGRSPTEARQKFRRKPGQRSDKSPDGSLDKNPEG
jgi:hypothetical protein